MLILASLPSPVLEGILPVFFLDLLLVDDRCDWVYVFVPGTDSDFNDDRLER